MVGLAYYLVEVENKVFWSLAYASLRETRLEPTGFLFLNSITDKDGIITRVRGEKEAVFKISALLTKDCIRDIRRKIVLG